MSSETDVMDEDTRLALHSALDDAVRPDTRKTDVYQREASAWLKPGLPYSEVLLRVKNEMGLTQAEPGPDLQCVSFCIEHSKVYSHLELTFSSDKLVNFHFTSINGQQAD